MKNKKILLISPEGWGPNFVSKHHYANYLAKSNTVYFLNPVLGSVINPLGSVNVKKQEIKENLCLVSYRNLLPRLNILPKFVQKFIFKIQARQIQRSLDILKFDLIWNFDPYRYWDQSVWKSDKTIYHTVDFHPKAKYENEICKTSTTVVGVTPLVNDSIKDYVEVIHRIGHGADIDNFGTKVEVNIPGKNKIKACYTGNFHKHINYELLIELATQNREIDFILIGPLKDNNLSSGSQIEDDNLKQLNDQVNVFLIGSVPSNQLMNYLSLCDINLVLFKKEFEITHCSPHKLMAYFYSGNITLSNYIDEHKGTDSDIILMMDSENDVLKKIKEIKTNLESCNSESLIDKRRNFAIANSYEVKIEEISRILYN